MPNNIQGHDISGGLDRVLVLEVARVTEAAAISAARLRGRGDEKAADKAEGSAADSDKSADKAEKAADAAKK